MLTNAEINERIAKWLEPEPGPLVCDSDRLMAGGVYFSPNKVWVAVMLDKESHIVAWQPRDFANDIRPAWLVIEKLRDTMEYCCIDVSSDYNYCYSVTVRKDYGANPGHEVLVHVDEDTAPLAICVAALRVMELGPLAQFGRASDL